jgi:hypothetical protein
MPRPTRLLVLLAAPAAITAIAGGSGAAAQNPGPRTLVFKERQRDATFAHIRNTRPKTRRTNSAGDIFVLTSTLLDADGKVAGKTAATCITSTGARDFRKSLITCSGVFTLPDGTLTIQGNISPAVEDRIVAAVTGGTGAYAGARGALEFAGGVDTITLVP